jgi:cellobiose-specific phosphotransferase system component IIB
VADDDIRREVEHERQAAAQRYETSQREATARRDREVHDAVTALNAIQAGDAEAAHGQADDVLLSLVSPQVRAAYEAVKDRAPWWASA